MPCLSATSVAARPDRQEFSAPAPLQRGMPLCGPSIAALQRRQRPAVLQAAAAMPSESAPANFGAPFS
jgi:hypothetical protein